MPPEPALVTAEVVEKTIRPIERILEKPQAAEAKPQVAAAKIQKPAAKIEPPPPVPPPRKSFGDLLVSFLEDRDIHWGELAGVLLGGLLTIGGSVMFVIAYWNRLESSMKFSIFAIYSLMIFAAGLFALHRWKLQSTGRGLLTIGILLAPLNFLAMAGGQGSVSMTIVELLAIGAFAWLVALAAKALMRGGQWPMVTAVIGNSVLILLVGQFLGGIMSPMAWMGSAIVAAGLFTVAAMWHLRQVVGTFPAILSSTQPAEKAAIADMLPAINSLFMLLAVAGYATVMGMVFVAAKASLIPGIGVPLAMQLLAAPLSLAAMPVLSAGLILQRRLPADTKLEGHRTAATMIALFGVVLQLAALVLAWPQPMLIVAVGVLAAACLAYLALHYDFPACHAGAMIGATIAFLAAFYVFFGQDLPDWQNRTLLMESTQLGKKLLHFVVSSTSGMAMGGLFVVFAAISEYFARRGRKEHGAIYASGSCIVAVLGLSLVTVHGFLGNLADAICATSLYSLYGLVGVLLALRWNRKPLSYIGWNLLAAAPFWLLQKFSIAAWQDDLALAGCLFWTAAVWLVLAWQHRSAVVLAIQQIILSLAALAGTFAWLVQQGWISTTKLPGDLLKAHNLQAFAAALAALSLAWIIVRFAVRRQERFERLLNPGWLPVDKIVGSGLVVMQAFMLLPFVFKGLWHEIQLSGTVADLQSYCGPTAWILLILLAAVNATSLWDRWEKSRLLCSVILAASVPCLVAGRFSTDAANASALRWGLATTFLFISAAIWFRGQLYKRLTAWGAKIDPDDNSPLIARIITAALTAVPVVAITVFMAVIQLTGTRLNGPASGIFATMGPNWSYLVPLALVIAGTVGHALRESSAVNAFLAGLVVELAVMLGYPLQLATSSPARKFGTTEFMVWVQLMTIAAAAWAIAWLLARLWVNVWREDIGPQSASGAMPTLAVGMKGDGTVPYMPTASVGMAPRMAPRMASHSVASMLMHVQFGFAVLGNVVLLGMALLEIIVRESPRGSLHVSLQAGMPLGWIAFGLTAAAGGYRTWQRGRKFSPHAVGLTGMGVLALLACTVSNLPMPAGVVMGGTLAYRVLMIGWACYALLIAVATWWVASQRTLPGAVGPPQALIRLAAVWVRVAGIAAVLLGLKAGFRHDDLDGERLWAAAGIAIASLAGATMAVWRRREGWAFCAAVGVNVAASLVVWHVEEARGALFEEWWLRLAQANIIASSLVGLVWLAAHRRLYQLRDLSVRQSPLLAVQIVLPVLANAAILLIPLAYLLEHPESLTAWMHGFADPPGWVSLLLPAAAGLWYIERTLPGKLIHALAGLGLGAGVLVACQSHSFGPFFAGEWMEYRVLFSSWTAAAVILLAMTCVANVRRLAALPNLNLSRHFSTDAGKLWISAISILAAALVARSCAWDIGGVRWSLAVVGTLIVTAGLIAVWLRSAEHVVFSGLLMNLAGVVAWFAFGKQNAANFLEFQVLCLAAAAAAWTLPEIARLDLVPHFQIIGGGIKKALPFAHVAIVVAIMLLAVPVVCGLFGVLSGLGHDPLGRLGWFALAAVAGVLTLMLWDRRATYVWMGLYLVGLAGVGMVWLHAAFPPKMIYWLAASDFAAYSLGAALIGRFIPFVRRGCRYLLIPDGEKRWAANWFMPSQAILATVATIMCVWLAIDFQFTGVGMDVALLGIGGRYAGVTGLLMVLGAAILMAAQCSRNIWDIVPTLTVGMSEAERKSLMPTASVGMAPCNRARESWQSAAFVIGLLFMAAIRWAGLDSSDSMILFAPWLHRSIAMLLSAAMMCMLTTFGLPQVSKRLWDPLFPQNPANPKSTWSDAGRKILPYFAALTLGLLAIVLVQEGWLFNPESGAPATISETIIVAGVMAAMLALVLVFALRTDFDPLKLSESGRQAYVYAAEALLALIGLHVWMTNPHLFQLGIIKKYWMFLVMGVAFSGAGLSELFHRRKLPVLSRPLERTALWLPVLPVLGFWLIAPDALNWGLIGRTPWLWFLIGGFYGTMAYMRRSPVCGCWPF